MSVVTGVDFVCVPSADFERALEFYGEVLGLERSSVWQRGDEPPAGAEFETGNMTIAVIGTAGARDGVQPEHACRSPCRSRTSRRPGPSSSRAASRSHGETIDSGVCHIANFRDREGNALMLHHRYAPFKPPGAAALRVTVMPSA